MVSNVQLIYSVLSILTVASNHTRFTGILYASIGTLTAPCYSEGAKGEHRGRGGCGVAKVHSQG